MKRNLTSRLRSWLPRKPLLVCETDGFSLRGAVVSRASDGLKVHYSAATSTTDMRAAVGELVQGLKAQGWAGGKAVLLTPGVVPALLQLPVEAGKPRKPAQMQALVRYELEPVLMDYASLWAIGRMLVGCGYLSREQAREIIEAQAGRKVQSFTDREAKPYTFQRFGDLAIERSYITRRQLDEALHRQEWFSIDMEDVMCGWAPQGSADAEAGGGSSWLATGAGQRAARHWLEAFAAHGVVLDALYPIVGCAAAGLPSEGKAPVLVLEMHACLVLGMRINDGRIEAISMTKPCTPGTDLDHLLEIYHALVPPEPASVWLAGRQQGVGDLAAELGRVTGNPVQVLQAPATGEMTAGMAGASRHALGMGGSEWVCEIPAAGPRIPLAQRPELRLAAGGGLLLLAVGVAEAVLQVRYHMVAEQHAQVAARAKEFDTARAGVQAQIDKIRAEREKIKAVKDETARLEARLGFYGGTLSDRAALVQGVLEELTRSVSDDVVVDKIEESPRDGFRIHAWSLTERGATQFVQAFKEAMEPWEVLIEEVQVTPQQGRYGLPGVGVRFRAVAVPQPLEEAKSAEPVPAANAKPAKKARS